LISTDIADLILEGNTVIVQNPQTAGVYQLVYSVCDNSGNPLCAEATVTLEIQPSYVPEISGFNVSPVTCFGALNGMAEVIVTDEGYNLIYQWTVDQNTSLAVYLEPGTYGVTVNSDAECAWPSYAEVYVNGASAPILIEGLTGLPINENPGGSGTYDVSGGQEPYTFAWYDGDGNLVSETMELGPLTESNQQGTYFLTVTDYFGCSVTQSITITNVGENDIQPILCYPNPASGLLNIELPAFLEGEVLKITDMAGRVVMQERYPVQNGRISINISGWSNGVYLIHLGNRVTEFVKL
jgi:hypothetical protein